VLDPICGLFENTVDTIVLEVKRRSCVPEKDSFDIAHSFSVTKFVSRR
jgi:hypothetical protein